MHRELFKVLFLLWGSRAFYMAYHQIDVTYSTCYHGEEPLHALLTLHSFTCFSTLKARTLYSSIRGKHEAHSLQHHFCCTVQSSKHLLSDQFVLTFVFLLASNLVSHWIKLLFCFLNKQPLSASLLTYVFSHSKAIKTAKKSQPLLVPLLKRGDTIHRFRHSHKGPAAVPLLSTGSSVMASQPWGLPSSQRQLGARNFRREKITSMGMEAELLA